MPASGYMYWWRFKRSAPGAWHFGYCTWLGSGMVRMGAYNGDTTGGSAVVALEIEWRDYSSNP